MISQCRSSEWVLASSVLVDELWNNAEGYARRDEILHALVLGARTQQEPGWCCAMLHLAMHPKLSSMRARKSPPTWSELHSALDGAIEGYALHLTTKVAANLSGDTLKHLNAENKQAAIEARIGKKLEEVMEVFSLAEILSGDAREGFTKQDCQRALRQFELLGLVDPEDAPAILERFFPAKRPHTINERQHQTIAIKRLKKKTRHKMRRGPRNR